jgi:hypothetical protein
MRFGGIAIAADPQRSPHERANSKLTSAAGAGLERKAHPHMLRHEIDIELTGFSELEIDSLIETASAQEAADPADDKLPPLSGQTAVTQRGDLWVLDGHKVYCGDSRDAATFQAVLGRECAQMVFTDPPYKVDRLTRSLADFAKLVELFDQHSVSFVSVTQSNTTSSMGRLTLNVLLSFAHSGHRPVLMARSAAVANLRKAVRKR